MLSSEEDCPCDTAGIFALEEERFGLAVLEAEDLAITADVKLALFINLSAKESLPKRQFSSRSLSPERCANGRFVGGRGVEHTFPG